MAIHLDYSWLNMFTFNRKEWKQKCKCEQILLNVTDINSYISK